MFANWTGWKTVKGVLFVLSGVCPFLPANIAPTATEIVAAIGAAVVVLSGTNLGPAMAKSVKS